MIPSTIDVRAMATAEDLRAAFRLLLVREPDPEGLEHFGQLIGHGLPVAELVDKFLGSEEFRGLRKTRLALVDLGGYLVCVDPEDTDIGREVVATGDYEPHVRAAVAELFHPGETFVDIGANVGCLSLLAAKIAGPRGRVISIEPNPTNLQRIYAAIVLNRFENVRVLPYAASDRRATFSLGGGTSNTHLIDPTGFDVEARYAQSIVPDEELAGLDAIHLIKMDIEGHEPLALRGFTRLIRRHDPTLIVEFSPHCLLDSTDTDPKAFLDQLFGLFKTLKVIPADGVGEAPSFSEAIALMDFWARRDRETTESGVLAAGMLHLDLIATNR